MTDLGRSHRLALALYPATWRGRYGEETAQLTADLLADGSNPLAVLLDLLLGALRERLRPSVRGPVAEPIGIERPDLWRHRDWLYRRRLDRRASALFDPGERIIATFDGCTRRPRLRQLGSYWISNGGMLVSLNLYFRILFGPSMDGALAIAVATAVLGLLLRVTLRLRGARDVMIALTTNGAVECGVDVLGRPRVVLGREPGCLPRTGPAGRGWLRVEIGPIVVQTKRSNGFILCWAATSLVTLPITAGET